MSEARWHTVADDPPTETGWYFVWDGKYPRIITMSKSGSDRYWEKPNTCERSPLSTFQFWHPLEFPTESPESTDSFYDTNGWFVTAKLAPLASGTVFVWDDEKSILIHFSDSSWHPLNTDIVYPLSRYSHWKPLFYPDNCLNTNAVRVSAGLPEIKELMLL